MTSGGWGVGWEKKMLKCESRGDVSREIRASGGLFGERQMIKSYIFTVVSNEETSSCSVERQAFI